MRRVQMALIAVWAAGAGAAPGRSCAAEELAPSFGLTIGGYAGSDLHSYLTESHVELPMYRRGDLSTAYRQRQTTPFFRNGAQAELLSARYEIETDLRLGDALKLVTVGGYRTLSLEDRPGHRRAGVLGAGLCAPAEPDSAGPEWQIVGGGYLSTEGMGDDWWAELHGAWFVSRLPEDEWLGTRVRPAPGLAADVELSGERAAVHSRIRIGPVLDFITANGNTARFQAAWYRVDDHPFYERSDSAWLIAMGLTSALDAPAAERARVRQTAGWLPLVWGEYELGAGTDRTLQRMELEAEFHDFFLGGHRFTGRMSYEARQEMRPGDFDNISYTGVVGLQSELGRGCAWTHRQPLVFGVDYLHRSAHALDPDAGRVPGSAPLARDSINLLPRLRLQTRGWDLPYRDPAAYRLETRWLNRLEGRITAGFDVRSSRERGSPAAQLGLRWDLAAVRGAAVYACGLASTGNETPDWLAELGVRRPAGHLFLRGESYGLESPLARGHALVAGVGFHL